MFWVLSRDDPFEYPQHMFWLRNKKNNIQLRTLICGPKLLPDGDLSFITCSPFSHEKISEKDAYLRRYRHFVKKRF